MGCGYFACSKNALLALNILYILIAILLIGVAAYAKAISLVNSLTIIGAVIACGVFLLLIACMGFIGASKHHQICLFFYMVILFLLFLVQFSLAVALLAITKDTQKDLVKTGWVDSSNDTKEDITHILSCCGLDKWNPTEPQCSSTFSCCKNNKGAVPACCGGTDTSIPCNCPTCGTKLEKYSNMACKITGGVGMFISITEIIGVWLALRFRNMKDPSADPNAFL